MQSEKGKVKNAEFSSGSSLFTFPFSLFTVPVPRVGIEPTLPRRAAALQAARRPTARPKASPDRSGVARVGVEPTHLQGFSLAALPVGVPCRLYPEPPVGVEPTRPPYQDGRLPLHHGGIRQQSAQWESNPHFRHGKTAGCRYIMGASHPPS